MYNHTYQNKCLQNAKITNSMLIFHKFVRPNADLGNNEVIICDNNDVVKIVDILVSADTNAEIARSEINTGVMDTNLGEVETVVVVDILGSTAVARDILPDIDIKQSKDLESAC